MKKIEFNNEIKKEFEQAFCEYIINPKKGKKEYESFYFNIFCKLNNIKYSKYTKPKSDKNEFADFIPINSNTEWNYELFTILDPNIFRIFRDYYKRIFIKSKSKNEKDKIWEELSLICATRTMHPVETLFWENNKSHLEKIKIKIKNNKSCKFRLIYYCDFLKFSKFKIFSAAKNINKSIIYQKACINVLISELNLKNNNLEIYFLYSDYKNQNEYIYSEKIFPNELKTNLNRKNKKIMEEFVKNFKIVKDDVKDEINTTYKKELNSIKDKYKYK